jgi:hypothetical protein
VDIIGRDESGRTFRLNLELVIVFILRLINDENNKIQLKLSDIGAIFSISDKISFIAWAKNKASPAKGFSSK